MANTIIMACAITGFNHIPSMSPHARDLAKVPTKVSFA
jgi:hypothetical protein